MCLETASKKSDGEMLSDGAVKEAIAQGIKASKQPEDVKVQWPDRDDQEQVVVDDVNRVERDTEDIKEERRWLDQHGKGAFN